MFKDQPKGLIVAFFANMGERFGFYTMMAILVLFLQAKFGLSGANAGIIYSVFYALIYALALVGGIMADRFIGLKKTIAMGIITMAAGYVLIAIPGLGLIPVCCGLFVIAFGNGLFKGNLQAVVGNLYEDPKYSHLRDSAFSIFYMGINIGALFAPTMAIKIRDYFLAQHGFGYNGDLPAICHKFINGDTDVAANLQEIAQQVSLSGTVGDLNAFATNYINAFSTGYNYAFGFAAIMMLVSLVVYFIFNKLLVPGFSIASASKADKKEAGVQAAAAAPSMSKADEKERLIALGLVFAVVIFFWMSFHQNGLTLTFFARDYVANQAAPSTYFWFDLSVLLPIFGAAVGVYMLIKKESEKKNRLIGLVLFIVLGAFGYWRYSSLPAESGISPEMFQHMNPFFIVSLTPVMVGIFSWLNKKNAEPSAPRKIGYGMILAALAFAFMMIGSFGLTSMADLNGTPSPDRVSPYLLIGVYFTLTIAELFLSPMGISFVSKVAPPRFKGIMQGGWLCATAIGNQLLFVGALLYDRIELWQLWAFFVVCCLISAAFIFGVMKRLEKVAK